MSADSVVTNAAVRSRKPILDGINSAAQATSEGTMLTAIRRQIVLSVWETAPIASPQ